jgi:serine/threonine protein kinase HipA of HipAB toxin-antitoxin module
MTDADDFYSGFKDALDFIGVAWSRKHWANVYVDGNKIVFEHDGRTATIELKAKEE